MKLVIISVALFVLVTSAWAFELRSNSSVTVPQQSVVDDDLLAAGNQIDISGRVNGSVLTAGNTVSVTGPVEGFLAAAGSTITLGGPKEAVTAAGSSVQARSLSARNAALAGSTISVDSSSSITRDLLAGGTTVLVSGTIGRNLRVSGKNVSIAGNIGGDAEVTAQQISVLPGAVIRGNFIYRSQNQASISRDAKILGRVIRRPLPRRPAGPGRFLFRLLRFLAMLAFGALLVAIFPRWTTGAARRVIDQPGWSALWGLVVLVATPIAIIIAFITLIGIPIGLAGLAGYIIALMVAAVVTSIAVGALALRRQSIWLQLLLGLAIVYVASAIPFLGIAVRIAVLLFGLGALALSFARPRLQPA